MIVKTSIQLADLIADPNKVNDVSLEAVAALRGESATLDTVLLARLLSGGNGQAELPTQGDRRLGEALEFRGGDEGSREAHASRVSTSTAKRYG